MMPMDGNRKPGERTFTVIVEQDAEGFSAYIPALPGCVTVGTSLEELRANMREAASLYIEASRERGMPTQVIPAPDEDYSGCLISSFQLRTSNL